MDFDAAKALCLTFPGCTEDLKWGHVVVYSVGTKMFACCPDEPDVRQMSFKAADERFLELTDRPGIIPAPYMARMKWVQVKGKKALSDAEAAELLRSAYELVFAKLSKKLQREITAASASL